MEASIGRVQPALWNKSWIYSILTLLVLISFCISLPPCTIPSWIQLKILKKEDLSLRKALWRLWSACIHGVLFMFQRHSSYYNPCEPALVPGWTSQFKAAIINIFIISMTQMMCNVKHVAYSGELTENYHPIFQSFEAGFTFPCSCYGPQCHSFVSLSQKHKF